LPVLNSKPEGLSSVGLENRYGSLAHREFKISPSPLNVTKGTGAVIVPFAQCLPEQEPETVDQVTPWSAAEDLPVADVKLLEQCAEQFVPVGLIS